MEMAERDEIEFVECRAGLAKTQEGATSDVYDDFRLAVDPDQVGRRSPAVIRDRTTGPEYLQLYAGTCRAVVRGGGRAS